MWFMWISSLPVKNLLLDFAAPASKTCCPGDETASFTAEETASSFAEWFAEDQKA